MVFALRHGKPHSFPSVPEELCLLLAAHSEHAQHFPPRRAHRTLRPFGTQPTSATELSFENLRWPHPAPQPLTVGRPLPVWCQMPPCTLFFEDPLWSTSPPDKHVFCTCLVSESRSRLPTFYAFWQTLNLLTHRLPFQVVAGLRANFRRQRDVLCAVGPLSPIWKISARRETSF